MKKLINILIIFLITLTAKSQIENYPWYWQNHLAPVFIADTADFLGKVKFGTNGTYIDSIKWVGGTAYVYGDSTTVKWIANPGTGDVSGQMLSDSTQHAIDSSANYTNAQISAIDSTWQYITILGGVILSGGDTLKDIYPLNDSIMWVINSDTSCVSGCIGSGGSGLNITTTDTANWNYAYRYIFDSINLDSIGVVLDVDLTGGATTQVNTGQSLSQPKVISIVDTLYNEYVNSFDIQYRLSGTWYIDIYSATSYDSLTIFYIKDDAGLNPGGGNPILANVTESDTTRWGSSSGGGEVDTTGLPVANQIAYFTAANKIGGSDLTINHLSIVDDNNTTGFGYQSLSQICTAGEVGYNSAFGYQSQYSVVCGSATYNSSLGALSLYSNTGGGDNVALGYKTLYNLISSSSNIAIGSLSLYGNTTGDRNIAIGSLSLYGNTTGDRNIAIGYYAGRYLTTESDRFIISNFDQSTKAGDTTNAFMYGLMSTTSSNAQLYLNSNVNIKHNLEVDGDTGIFNNDIHIYGISRTEGNPKFYASCADSARNIDLTQNVYSSFLDTLLTVNRNRGGFTFQGDSVQIPVTGWYKARTVIDFEGSATASKFHGEYSVNGSLILNKGTFSRSTSTTALFGSTAMEMAYYFTAGDWVKPMITNQSNNTDVTIENVDWFIDWDE